MRQGEETLFALETKVQGVVGEKICTWHLPGVVKLF